MKVRVDIFHWYFEIAGHRTDNPDICLMRDDHVYVFTRKGIVFEGGPCNFCHACDGMFEKPVPFHFEVKWLQLDIGKGFGDVGVSVCRIEQVPEFTI